MFQAFQVSVLHPKNLSRKYQTTLPGLVRNRTCKSRSFNSLQIYASVTLSRRRLIRLAVLTGVCWRLAVVKESANADGAVSFATKITSRRRYGPRILGLEQDIKDLFEYIHNNEWNKVEELVSERYLNAQNKPKSGKFWSEKAAFQLFSSGVFRDNKDVLKSLENEEQQFFSAAARLGKAASNHDLEGCERAYMDLKDAYYKFLAQGQLKNPESANV